MKKGTFRGSFSGSKGGTQKGARTGLTKGLYSTPRARGFDNFLIIGDSTAAGSGVAPYAGQLPGRCPIVKPGTAREYYNGQFYNVGTFSRSDTWPNTPASPWPQFCVDYFKGTGRIPYICNRAFGGSTISSVVSWSNHWQTSGDNYNPAIADADRMIGTTGKKLTAIFVMLGVNDARAITMSSITLPGVSTQLDTLVSNLQTKYPGIPIVWCQIGRLEVASAANGFNAGVAGVRGLIKDKARGVADFHIGATYTPLEGTNLMNADLIHANFNGCNYIGASFAKWCINRTYSKWARSIISVHFDELSQRHKALWETFITNFGTEYAQMDALYRFKTTDRRNTFVDFSFFNCPRADGLFDFTPNAYIETASGKNFRTGYDFSLSKHQTVNTDMIIGVKTANSPANAVDNAPMTVASGANLTGLRDNGGIAYYLGSTGGGAYATDTSFASDSEYAVRRLATTLTLYKNGVSVGTQAITNVAFLSVEAIVGARWDGGSLTEPFIGQLLRFWIANATVVGASAAGTALDAIDNGW